MKIIKIISNRLAAVAVLFIMGAGSLFAQNSGVYKTYTDYKAGKLEYSIKCASETHKIELNDFFAKDYFTVVHNGKSYNLKKADTWGFLLCENKLVRFQGKDHFDVKEKELLWIYVQKAVMPSSGKNTGLKTTDKYFFSKGGDGEIKELTLLNLKATYPDNHKLHDAIDAYFKSDALLSKFDQFHKKFKINHLLEMQDVK